jgi:GAF domain-containing protein
VTDDPKRHNPTPAPANQPSPQRWEEVAALASKEQDPNKLLALVQELNDLLLQRERRLASPNNPASFLRDSTPLPKTTEAHGQNGRHHSESDFGLRLRNNPQLACEEIVDRAAALMRSDYASLQMLFPERGTGGELLLLGFRGFNPQAAKFWEWVRADSKSTCGLALRDTRRVIAADISRCEFMADSEDQQVYLQTGILACQTTPLISGAGNVVGMISTHWRTPHQPSKQELRDFDLLARDAAERIERCRREKSW